MLIVPMFFHLRMIISTRFYRELINLPCMFVSLISFKGVHSNGTACGSGDLI